MPTGISGLYKNTKGAKASPRTHHVKILPDYFKAVKNGTKTFEIRLNDRDYKVGDMICLEEYRDGAYTGKVISKEICYMIDGPAYCKEGYVVLGLKQCAPDENVGGKSESEQTREMQVDLMLCIVKSDNGEVKCGDTAQRLYNAGWRKQSEGEWKVTRTARRIYIKCTHCNYTKHFDRLESITDERKYILNDFINEHTFCPNCGAKIKGGSEE